MADAPVPYTSDVDDNLRWTGFPYRDGDIVISTRSKSGTTWVQMICALLVFQTPKLPAPLAELSPWLDWMVVSRDEVFASLASQTHRRFIKSHTPLDGIPIDQRASYLVVVREPLDMAVSLYHQGANMNRERVNELLGLAPPEPRSPRPPLRPWLLEWVDEDAEPRDRLDSLPGVVWHAADAWARRHEPNVVLIHYDDLMADLGGEMRRIARRLRIEVDNDVWPTLIEAATFDHMRRQPSENAPDPAGVLHDKGAFFRRGSSGAGAELLTAPELAHYRERVHQLAARFDSDVADWLAR